KEAREKRHFPLIVVDPRVTMLAQFADIHLPITPGTDCVLINAMLHVIISEGLQDQAYIDAHCNGFEELRALVADYNPIQAQHICGIDEDLIRHVARLYARAGAAMSIWTMGINQSTHGSDGVANINNLNLVTGNIGKPGYSGGRWHEATNPMTGWPKGGGIDKIMEKLGFLVGENVYEDLETTRYSDLYRPAAVWAEKEGGHTNTERRGNLTRSMWEPY